MQKCNKPQIHINCEGGGKGPSDVGPKAPLETSRADISARLHKLDDTAAEQMKHLSWIFIKMPLLEKCD